MFPQGLLHYGQNLNCEPATYISSLSSEDPGLSTVSLAMAKLPTEAMTVTFDLDGREWSEIAANLPVSIAQGRDECLKYCASLKY